MFAITFLLDKDGKALIIRLENICNTNPISMVNITSIKKVLDDNTCESIIRDPPIILHQMISKIIIINIELNNPFNILKIITLHGEQKNLFNKNVNKNNTKHLNPIQHYSLVPNIFI